MALQNWKDIFLAELTASPNISRAARVAAVDRSHAYDTKRADPEFSRRWDDALAGALDDVEEEAYRRARTESDTLAIFLLKSHRPETYNQPTRHQHEGATPVILHGADEPADDPIGPTPGTPPGPAEDS